MNTPSQLPFDSVVCFGDSDWWYHNRGHADMQFMRRFTRRWPVLYINSLGMKAPSLAERGMFLRKVFRKAKSIRRFYKDGGEGFPVLSPIFYPKFDGLSGKILSRALAFQVKSVLRARSMRRPLLWVACPSAAVVLDYLPRAKLVYQLSDFYTGLNSGHSLQAAMFEEKIARAADLVICSSRALLDHARTKYGKGEYVDHGVDFELFDAATKNPVCPPELANVPRPIVGFFGNMDGNTIDRDLLERVIQLRPNYTFALVGPKTIDFERLARYPNVVSIPQKPYREIPRYGAAFDVCIMPWRQNEWIKHCNPVKLKEYLALGKPVVSTPFPELDQYAEFCLVATGPESFSQGIDQSLAENTSVELKRRKTWSTRHAWDGKYELALEKLIKDGSRIAT